MNLKINISLFLLLFLAFSTPAQNLVPNPSFETLANCPTANSQYHLASPWQKPNSSITTPDLFNTCFTGGGTCNAVGVPSNFGGSSNARTGNGYTGIITKYTVSNLREYLVVQLNSPLQAGETYDVGAYILLAERSRYSTNNFGLHLTSGMLSQTTGCCNNGTINLNPSIEENNVVSDRNNWTLIGGTYTASGGEQFLTIGCFSPDNQNTIVDHGSQGGTCALVTSGSYYYVDDVYVRPSAPLPVEGLEFQATAFSDHQAMLSWTFRDASDYTSIRLERSEDGIQFETLQDQLSAEDGNYLDNRPFAPASWYRLRATDKNGEIHYSEIRQLEFKAEVGFAVKAWPNPLQDQLTIEIQSEQEEQIYQIELQDYLGHSLRKMEVRFNSGNPPLVLSNLQQLSAGFYLLKVSNGSQQIIKKLTRI